MSVRGILNKLTPQTFDRLSEELVNIGLDSIVLLKGVILLIFEKALQEPKYVCMYAQLCKKLSKKVPNFDPPNPDYTTTFRRLLLNKCQDEYENRARASAMFDQRTERLTPDEEEEKLLAKRKMLGNIKFIGELGKLEMLTHSILHKCCEELVKKTKAEDLECLCQIMSTCGHLLDNDKGKYLMDQYFSRMNELSQIEKLPSRIRFMLQDVLELRENHWLPRQTISQKESPKPIQEIRREAQDELGISDGTRSPQEDFRYLQIGRNPRLMGSKKNRTGMEDVFAPVPLAMTSLGTGPGVITLSEKTLGIESNGYHHPGPAQNYRPSGGMRNFNNHNNVGFTNHFMQHKSNKMNHYDHHGQQNNMHHNNMRNNHNNINTNGYDKAPVAPRFMKQGQNPQINNMGNSGAITQMAPASEELSLRPPPNSMMKMFPNNMKPNVFIPVLNETKAITVIQQAQIQNVSSITKEQTSVSSNAKNTLEKMKPKKEKGPTKEDILKKSEDLIDEYLQHKYEHVTTGLLKELKIPDKFMTDVLTAVLNKALDQNESERELIYFLMMQAVKDELASRAQFLEAFRNMLDLMGDLEADIPRIKSYVAAFAALAISEHVFTLAEVAESVENGNHYPFLLLVMQQLGKTMDKHKLCKLFDESKINLLNTLPKIDRTKDRMAEILEERELHFLFPLLKIQAEMAKQLLTNCETGDFLTWIKDNVDPTYYTAQGFISALITVIFKYVTSVASHSIGTEVIGGNEKAIKEKEKELLLKLKPVIGKFLRDQADLQIIAVYALQAAWFVADSPKVMLLRWFMNMYELEIIEEEAFLKWKEDIRDDYPGKGKALFQVNQWLLWLEQADEEDEDGDGDQDN